MMKIDHIGYAVAETEKAAAAFLDLGYSVLGLCGGGGYIDDPFRRVRICFLSDPRGVKVELVAPLGENSPVSVWLGKNGPSPYHIAYESGDVPADAANLKKRGFLLVEPPAPALAYGGRTVAFLYGKAAGLIELVPADQEFTDIMAEIVTEMM
ncbi:MAG: VOC family protein [Synergistaceae bacterium]|jgi:methylmalonyl-CoA/ethylmalonyl-CoA epimerase|nr:VOC family protein [Synergistaceae bacterium]